MSSTSCAYVLSVLYLCRLRPVLMLSLSAKAMAFAFVVIYGLVLNASVIIIIFGIYNFGLNLVAPASLASLATGSAVAREAVC